MTLGWCVNCGRPLYGYTSGVFSCDGEEGNDGGHAVIMVGWGEEGGVKYVSPSDLQPFQASDL